MQISMIFHVAKTRTHCGSTVIYCKFSKFEAGTSVVVGLAWHHLVSFFAFAPQTS